MLLLLACADDSGTCDGTTYLLSGGTGTDASIDASLSIPVYTTAEEVDVLVDWSAVDQDMYCLAMEPVEDVDAVGVLMYSHLSHAEIEAALVADAAVSADEGAYFYCKPGDATSCLFSEVTYQGGSVPFSSLYADNDASYLVVLMDGEDFDAEARHLAFLDPDPASDVTEVYLQPTCPQLTMDVDLSRTSTSRETSGCGGSKANSWPIDWSDLTYAMTGDSVRPGGVDQVVIARYDVSVDELEAQFVIRDSFAAERYTLAMTGTSADLADATTENGDAFVGYSGSGVWLLELRKEGGLPIPIWAGVVGG